MQPTNLAEVIQYIAKQQQEQMVAKIGDAQERVMTVAYDKAATYTTIVIFGGYAGFFGIWQLTRDYLTKEQALWSAILILLSLLAFVLFEVIKLIVVSVGIIKQAAVLRDPTLKSDPERLLRALDEMQKSQTRVLWPVLVFWAVTVAVSLGGAIGGASVLVCAFVGSLVK